MSSFFDLLSLASRPSPVVSVFARQALLFTPDPLQTAILDSPHPSVILLCTRQFGKTSLTAIKAAHHALSRPSAKVVVAAPTRRQSEILVSKSAACLARLGVRLRPSGLQTFGYTLPNSSKIFALPGKVDTNRGFDAVTLLIFDEAACVPDSLYHMATAFQAAVPDPQLWLLSSAGPQSGFFYEEWSDLARPWDRHKITAPQCPRISPEFLALERLRKGETIFRREYLCEFSSAGFCLLSADLIESALTPDPHWCPSASVRSETPCLTKKPK